MDIHCEIRELQLRDPFGVSRGTRRSVRNLFIRVGEGWGEGAPVYYEGQSAEAMLDLAQDMLSTLDLALPIHEIVDEILTRHPGESALAQAVDIALHDAWGKREGQPLWRLWNLDWANAPLSTFTIGLDSLETMLAKVDQAQSYPLLKIKAGGEDDLAMLRAIRERAGKPMLIDANEGWTFERTVEYLPALRELDIRMLEQPLPREDKAGYAQLREANRSAIPIFVDEGVQGPDDIAQWAGRVDGVNIKLAKCGGLARARRMIEIARGLGLGVMLGCMIESSLAVSAAAQLAPLLDYADLDGAELISNDPFVGMKLRQGRIETADAPGHGATPRALA